MHEFHTVHDLHLVNFSRASLDSSSMAFSSGNNGEYAKSGHLELLTKRSGTNHVTNNLITRGASVVDIFRDMGASQSHPWFTPVGTERTSPAQAFA